MSNFLQRGIYGYPADRGHVSMILLGDSIMRRNLDDTLVTMVLPMGGIMNWANWMLGSPFVVEHNSSVSGDMTNSTLSRISLIPDAVEAVGILVGINDLLSFSSASSQAQIDAKFTALSGSFLTSIKSLKNAGKKTLIMTIPPNAAFNTPSDARIQLLDRMNGFLMSQASRSVFIADIFSALWDSSQPTLRLFKANTSADGTHTNNNGSQIAGVVVKESARMLFNDCKANRNIYEGFHPQQSLYANFRSGTGGTAPVKTNGTGNLADGWRSINNAGTATFTLDNTELYTPDATMVGPWPNAPIGPEEFWQTFNITSAVANDNPRLRTVTLPTNLLTQVEGVFGGSEYFLEVEAWVSNAVNLRDVSLQAESFFTNGTSPADQAFQGSVSTVARAGSGTSAGLVDAIAASSYRVVYRTPRLRFPENINNVAGVSALASMNMIFTGNGSAVVKFARPRMWHKAQGVT